MNELAHHHAPNTDADSYEPVVIEVFDPKAGMVFGELTDGSQGPSVLAPWPAARFGAFGSPAGGAPQGPRQGPYPEDEKPKSFPGSTAIHRLQRLAALVDARAARRALGELDYEDEHACAAFAKDHGIDIWSVRMPYTTTKPKQGLPWVQRTRSGVEIPFCMRTKKVWKTLCENGHVAKKYVPCGGLDCKTCEEYVSRRRGNRHFARFGGVDLGAWVFTMPRSWHPLLSVEDVVWMRKLVGRILTEGYRAWYGVDIGAILVAHPEGDKRPGVWSPHIHAEVPLAGIDTDTGALTKLPFKVDMDFIDLMRRLWGAVLGQVGAPGAIRPAGLPPAVPNAHYKYRRETHFKLHRFRYDHRAFPAWGAGNIGSLRRATYAGLCTPNARREGIEEWREAVRGDLEEAIQQAHEHSEDPKDPDQLVREARLCHVPGCGCTPAIAAVVDASKMDSIPGPLLDTWLLDLPDEWVDETHGRTPDVPPMPLPTPEDADDIPF